MAAAAKKSKNQAKNEDCEVIDEKQINSEDKINVPATKKQKVEEKSAPKPAAKKTSAALKPATKKAAKKKEDDEEDDDADDVDAPKLVQKFDKLEFVNASNGKEYNLKISTWNINGIRAWLKVLIITSRIPLLHGYFKYL